MSIQTINQTLLAGLLSAAILVPVARAETTGTVEVDENSEVTRTGGEITDECTFPGLELPDEFVVYAVGGYNARELDFQIDQSGDMATRSDFIVNSPSKPVVLMLSANEPNIWNIKWTENTDIVAVVASGSDPQKVAGLPRETPILTSTVGNGAKCGYFYLKRGRCDILNPLSKKLFGQQVDREYTLEKDRICPLLEDKEDYSSYSWIGEPREDEPKVFSSDDTIVDSFFDPTAPLTGLAAVEAAVEKGVLRKATEADIKAWKESYRQLHPEKNLPPATGEWYTDVYVVVNNFTYPNSIFGGDVTFLIPEGVPEPNGNPNDSTILYLETGECSGLFCDF